MSLHQTPQTIDGTRLWAVIAFLSELFSALHPITTPPAQGQKEGWGRLGDPAVQLDEEVYNTQHSNSGS